ncbi:MAG: hypothetical protein Q8P68_01945 [Candidatus Peregrinibacteria bacterium]|nr:hypothetical protein [Candidatus Peregrinibacteria bacterium]MDZ4244522.1 hypothetical protein [Candidatus Gracilibacteria bacterium]
MFELSLILGVLMLTISLAVLLDTKRMQKLLKELLDSPSDFFVLGLLNIVFGLIMLVQNHVLSLSFQGLFALLGWLITLRGLLMTWFTDELTAFGKKKVKQNGFVMFAGFVHLILGGGLLYFVWTMV